MYRPGAGRRDEVVLGHAAGTTPVGLVMEGERVVSGTILRTAQYLFRGSLFVEE